MIRTVGKAVSALLAFVLLAGVCAAGYFGWRGYDLYKEAGGRAALASMAETIRQNEDFVVLDDLPEVYVDAVLATEDQRFYWHFGIDPVAVGRALLHNVQAGRVVEGGSTITQQLAKTQFFTQEQELTRKAAEVFMSLALENAFTKKEILELYLNSIYFGEGYYGVGQASQGYFGTPATAMTAYESTMLAGIPNAPSAYAPTENPVLAAQRQAQVVRLMVEEGVMDARQAEGILTA